MTEPTIKQVYKLLSSYHRTGRLEFKWAIQRHDDNQASLIALQESHAARERRLLAGFMACAVVMLGSAGYSVWQTRKNAEITDKNYEMVGGLTEAFGNIIRDPDGSKQYTVTTFDGEKNGVFSYDHHSKCREYKVYDIDDVVVGGVPHKPNAKPVATFRIPEDCKP